MRYTHQDTQYTARRSVAETLLETINETLGQGDLAPILNGRHARRRRRFGRFAAVLLTVAMLAGTVTLGFAMLPPETEGLSPDAEPVAFLALSRGSVTMLGAGAQPAAHRLERPGTPIHPGAVIDTGDGESGGRTAVRLAGGQSVRLDAGSRVRFESRSSMTLERGAVYFDSRSGAGVEVRTALGVVRDIGTQFEVRLLPDVSPVLRVRVREGSVMLEQDDASHLAVAGEQLRIDATGNLKRDTTQVHGPRWNWVLDTAPTPEIAGKPLSSFLDWAAREGGWELRFADDETARIAAATVLHGDVRNLSVTEASSMVLQGSGLGYHLEGGAFVVELRPAEAD